MKHPAGRLSSWQLVFLLTLCLTNPSEVAAQQPEAASPTKALSDKDTPNRDSVPQPGAPHGKTFEFTFEHSRIFPGTTRKITVHVPAEYAVDTPACVYVGIDGLGEFDPSVC